jgi:H+/gluconate symporter-like permease
VPSQTPVRDFSAVSLPAALLPIVSVALVTLIMGSLVLPGLDTTYLALPQYGETEIGRVKGLWSVTVALVVAIGLALILTRPDKPLAELGAGAESALLPLFNTACLVGFGAVIASLPGFEALQTAMDGVAGGNLVVSAAVSAGALAGITGSASGGMSIALEALGPQLMAAALQQGTDPGLLHRVIALATGGLDTLPHNGAVVTLLGICGLTHREAYGDIFVVAVVIPLLACAVVIGLGLAFGGF